MVDFWSIGRDLLQAVILVFTCLSLGVAWSRARVHLAWLIPLALGQILSLLGSLYNLFMMSYIASRHGLFNHGFSQISWLLIPQQIVYGLGSLAGLWFAIAMFVTLRSQVAAPYQPSPMRTPGAWAPPPGSPMG